MSDAIRILSLGFASSELNMIQIVLDVAAKTLPRGFRLVKATETADVANERRADVRRLSSGRCCSGHADKKGNINVRTVWASRGKHTRAEPISGLYEQRRVHHVGDPKQFVEELL